MSYRHLFTSTLVCCFLVLAACSNKNTKETTRTGSNANHTALKIAYIDIDSLEANYEYLKEKKEEFEKRQIEVEGELQRAATKLQGEYESLQKRAQSGTLSQTEGEAAQKRLMQGQQSLEMRKQSLTEQLLNDRDSFNVKLQRKLDSFLMDYNKDRNYDFILRYSKEGGAIVSPIMLANPDFDITEDVIKGMNKNYKPVRDSSKKK